MTSTGDTTVTGLFHIRPATLADLGIVAHHRVSMFRDMGALQPGQVGRLLDITRAYLEDAMPRGEYVGWLAGPARSPDHIVAGAGVQTRRVLPFPRVQAEGEPEVAHGRQAIVLNVYTEPAFRRQGLARALMHEVLAWARATQLDSLVLHAAPDGRALYEALGFKPTNEMRFVGELATWQRPLDR